MATQIKAKMIKSIKSYGFSISCLIVIFLTACQKEPSASFTVSKSTVYVGENVSFSNTSKDSYNYLWNFGDNQLSIEASPTHKYTSAGTYTVTLKAFSKYNKIENEYSSTITVANSTDLALTVYLNGTTTPVENCQMRLFLTNDDWLHYTNLVTSGYTDVNGQIVFTNLNPVIYYIDAYKQVDVSGYYCNWFLGYITDTLVAGYVNNYIIYVEYKQSKGGNIKYKIVGIKPVYLQKK